MNCYKHNEIVAVASCAQGCGRSLCAACAEEYEPPTCEICAEKIEDAQTQEIQATRAEIIKRIVVTAF